MATHIANCLVCQGTGKSRHDDTKPCPNCKGRRPCRDCGATGEVNGQPCFGCKGKGVRRARRKCKHCKGTGKDVLGNKCLVCAGSGRAQKRSRTNAIVAGEVTSNSIEVGEFASDLIAATCYRERTGLVEGDFMDDPTRAMTDGACFGEETRKATQNTFQVTVSLDVSGSMYPWRANVANPLFYAMHKAMHDSIRMLPPGMLRYQPFIFGAISYPCPEAYMPYFKYVTTKGDRWGGAKTIFPPSSADYAARFLAVKEDLYKGHSVSMYEKNTVPDYLHGGGTYFDQLVAAIQAWEDKQEPVSGMLTKLDIVITDGGIAGVEDADRIQNERATGAKLRTVLLNVTGTLVANQQGKVPNHTEEFAVTLQMVTAQVRNVLMDSIQELLV
jgi:hypothetical protein